MLFAVDYNDNRIHVNDAHSNQEYFCPGCGAPLMVRRGEERIHHFAHKSNHICKDSWEIERCYETSEWHTEWQKKFPRDNQEVKLSLGQTIHRADVLINRTVVEFQRSIISPQHFDDRNNFYLNLGYKVIWLFDLSEQYEKGELYYDINEKSLSFIWKRPKKTFNAFDVQSGNIEVFFQIKESDIDSIVRVMEVSEHGFEKFETSKAMSKEDFLVYVGLENNTCLAPDRDDLSTNKKYQEFKEKYHVILNKQQERALQAIEGAVLLLAVPGSGKTTVLVDRIGYMVLVKNISPKNILALTYNTDAKQELQKRYDAKFGSYINSKVEIRTLNSLALKIYEQYCIEKKVVKRILVTGSKQNRIVIDICKRIRNVAYISHGEIQEILTAISYVKNMMDEANVVRYNNEINEFSEIYNQYQIELEKNHWMDFDDQLVFALNILQSFPEILGRYRNEYKYICVDEAQDTSKIQHEIIQLLSVGNSIFMVGDEDQSIYGFRGAYPKALLNFRYNYRNPYIIKMETNYRSTKQIVEAAQKFISRNKGRYEKYMISNRDTGAPINKITVKNRQEQYMELLQVARESHPDTAVLYRDNDSAVVIADLFFRNDVKFNLKRPERSFYENRIVQDMMAYLRLALDESDWEAFDRICRRGILYIKSHPQEYVVKICRAQKCSIYDALEQQRPYVKRHLDEIEKLKTVLRRAKDETTENAIRIIMNAGYEKYCRDENLDRGKLEILLMLAIQEPDIKSFLEHLKELEDKIKQGVTSDDINAILLSTIHTSKGQEYDTVYMIDVYDGRFPSSRMSAMLGSKDAATNEQEERRLFYVGITRAKNKLNLYEMKDSDSMFISELFGIEKRQNAFVVNNKPEVLNSLDYHKNKNNVIPLHKHNIDSVITEKEKNEIREEIRERIKKYSTTIVKDFLGHRWYQCKKCSKVDYEEEFAEKGGKHGLNYGICKDCDKKSEQDIYKQLKIEWE